VWLVLQKVADSLFVSHQVAPKPMVGALSLHTGAGASPHRVAALASASQSFLQAFFAFLHTLAFFVTLHVLDSVAHSSLHVSFFDATSDCDEHGGGDGATANGGGGAGDDEGGGAGDDEGGVAPPMSVTVESTCSAAGVAKESFPCTWKAVGCGVDVTLTVTTVMPRTSEAAEAVPRVDESEVCTSSAVMEAGTAMVAVIITLPAVTAIVTSDWSTPAAVATCCCTLEMSESE